MRKLSLTLIFTLLFCSNIHAAIVTAEIKYKEGDAELTGFLAYDDAIEGKRPGVIVVHEWWGHNEYVRKRARMLAEMGYTAFAVDMYGDGKLADHPDDAGSFASAVMGREDAGKARFLAGLEVLKAQETVDTEKIAAIGYCFGGATVLNMARMGVDLSGVVSFHGSLSSSKKAIKDKVKAKVLVCHGAADNFVTPEQITAFKQEMNDAGVDYTFNEYADAVHSFTNPAADMFAEKYGMGLRYNAAADQKSWADMKEFFKEIF